MSPRVAGAILRVLEAMRDELRCVRGLDAESDRSAARAARLREAALSAVYRYDRSSAHASLRTITDRLTVVAGQVSL